MWHTKLQPGLLYPGDNIPSMAYAGRSFFTGVVPHKPGPALKISRGQQPSLSPVNSDSPGLVGG